MRRIVLGGKPTAQWVEIDGQRIEGVRDIAVQHHAGPREIYHENYVMLSLTFTGDVRIINDDANREARQQVRDEIEVLEKRLMERREELAQLLNWRYGKQEW